MTTRNANARPLGLSSMDRAPLYHQIFLILRAKIFDGEFGSGAYLPGEREICESYKVSRITAVRALNELAKFGLVVRERGRGTRVQIVATGSVARGPSEYGGVDAAVSPISFEEPKKRSEADHAVTVIKFADVPAPAAAAAALRVPEGAIVQEAVRVSRFNKKPFNHLTTYVPRDLGSTWTAADLEKSSMVSLFKKAGVEFGLIEERVTATLADVELARRLRVSIGSPLIKIIRLTHDVSGRPIDYFVGFYPPDRYQYVVSLPGSVQPR